jgi:hypothetical protein
MGPAPIVQQPNVETPVAGADGRRKFLAHRPINARLRDNVQSWYDTYPEPHLSAVMHLGQRHVVLEVFLTFSYSVEVLHISVFL